MADAKPASPHPPDSREPALSPAPARSCTAPTTSPSPCCSVWWLASSSGGCVGRARTREARARTFHRARDGGAPASTSAPRLWPYLVQGRQSDLDLLTDLASRCGIHLTLRGSVLHLLMLEGEGAPLPLLLGESLLEAAIEVNADPACRSVSAAGWDVHAVEPHQAQASRARVGREVDAEAQALIVGFGTRPGDSRSGRRAPRCWAALVRWNPKGP